VKGLRLRPARAQDLKDILEIERLSFPSPWSTVHFYAELYKDYAHLWVAELDGKVVGYVCFWIIAGEAHLANIAVHPSFRRKGIGSFLLKTVLRFLKRRQVDRLLLEVRVSNKAARKFYEKFGFRKDGLRRSYYQDTGEDAVLMSKKLG